MTKKGSGSEEERKILRSESAIFNREVPVNLGENERPKTAAPGFNNLDDNREILAVTSDFEEQPLDISMQGPKELPNSDTDTVDENEFLDLEEVKDSSKKEIPVMTDAVDKNLRSQSPANANLTVDLDLEEGSVEKPTKTIYDLSDDSSSGSSLSGSNSSIDEEGEVRRTPSDGGSLGLELDDSSQKTDGTQRSKTFNPKRTNSFLSGLKGSSQIVPGETEEIDNAPNSLAEGFLDLTQYDLLSGTEDNQRKKPDETPNNKRKKSAFRKNESQVLPLGDSVNNEVEEKNQKQPVDSPLIEEKVTLAESDDITHDNKALEKSTHSDVTNDGQKTSSSASPSGSKRLNDAKSFVSLNSFASSKSKVDSASVEGNNEKESLGAEFADDLSVLTGDDDEASVVSQKSFKFINKETARKKNSSRSVVPLEEKENPESNLGDLEPTNALTPKPKSEKPSIPVSLQHQDSKVAPIEGIHNLDSNIEVDVARALSETVNSNNEDDSLGSVLTGSSDESKSPSTLTIKTPSTKGKMKSSKISSIDFDEHDGEFEGNNKSLKAKPESAFTPELTKFQDPKTVDTQEGINRGVENAPYDYVSNVSTDYSSRNKPKSRTVVPMGDNEDLSVRSELTESSSIQDNETKTSPTFIDKLASKIGQSKTPKISATNPDNDDELEAQSSNASLKVKPNNTPVQGPKKYTRPKIDPEADVKSLNSFASSKSGSKKNNDVRLKIKASPSPEYNDSQVVPAEPDEEKAFSTSSEKEKDAKYDYGSDVGSATTFPSQKEENNNIANEHYDYADEVSTVFSKNTDLSRDKPRNERIESPDSEEESIYDESDKISAQLSQSGSLGSVLTDVSGTTYSSVNTYQTHSSKDSKRLKEASEKESPTGVEVDKKTNPPKAKTGSFFNRLRRKNSGISPERDMQGTVPENDSVSTIHSESESDLSQLLEETHSKDLMMAERKKPVKKNKRKIKEGTVLPSNEKNAVDSGSSIDFSSENGDEKSYLLSDDGSSSNPDLMDSPQVRTKEEGQTIQSIGSAFTSASGNHGADKKSANLLSPETNNSYSNINSDEESEPSSYDSEIDSLKVETTGSMNQDEAIASPKFNSITTLSENDDKKYVLSDDSSLGSFDSDDSPHVKNKEESRPSSNDSEKSSGREKMVENIHQDETIESSKSNSNVSSSEDEPKKADKSKVPIALSSEENPEKSDHVDINDFTKDTLSQVSDSDASVLTPVSNKNTSPQLDDHSFSTFVSEDSPPVRMGNATSSSTIKEAKNVGSRDESVITPVSNKNKSPQFDDHSLSTFVSEDSPPVRMGNANRSSTIKEEENVGSRDESVITPVSNKNKSPQFDDHSLSTFASEGSPPVRMGNANRSSTIKEGENLGSRDKIPPSSNDSKATPSEEKRNGSEEQIMSKESFNSSIATFEDELEEKPKAIKRPFFRSIGNKNKVAPLPKDSIEETEENPRAASNEGRELDPGSVLEGSLPVKATEEETSFKSSAESAFTPVSSNSRDLSSSEPSVHQKDEASENKLVTQPDSGQILEESKNPSVKELNIPAEDDGFSTSFASEDSLPVKIVNPTLSLNPKVTEEKTSFKSSDELQSVPVSNNRNADQSVDSDVESNDKSLPFNDDSKETPLMKEENGSEEAFLLRKSSNPNVVTSEEEPKVKKRPFFHKIANRSKVVPLPEDSIDDIEENPRASSNERRELDSEDEKTIDSKSPDKGNQKREAPGNDVSYDDDNSSDGFSERVAETQPAKEKSGLFDRVRKFFWKESKDDLSTSSHDSKLSSLNEDSASLPENFAFNHHQDASPEKLVLQDVVDEAMPHVVDTKSVKRKRSFDLEEVSEKKKVKTVPNQERKEGKIAFGNFEEMGKEPLANAQFNSYKKGDYPPEELFEKTPKNTKIESNEEDAAAQEEESPEELFEQTPKNTKIESNEEDAAAQEEESIVDALIYSEHSVESQNSFVSSEEIQGVPEYQASVPVFGDEDNASENENKNEELLPNRTPFFGSGDLNVDYMLTRRDKGQRTHSSPDNSNLSEDGREEKKEERSFVSSLSGENDYSSLKELEKLAVNDNVDIERFINAAMRSKNGEYSKRIVDQILRINGGLGTKDATLSFPRIFDSISDNSYNKDEYKSIKATLNTYSRTLYYKNLREISLQEKDQSFDDIDANNANLGAKFYYFTPHKKDGINQDGTLSGINLYYSTLRNNSSEELQKLLLVRSGKLESYKIGLLIAGARGGVGNAKILLNQDESNKVTLMTHKNNVGDTALSLAIYNNKEDFAKFFIEEIHKQKNKEHAKFFVKNLSELKIRLEADLNDKGPNENSENSLKLLELCQVKLGAIAGIENSQTQIMPPRVELKKQYFKSINKPKFLVEDRVVSHVPEKSLSDWSGNKKRQDLNNLYLNAAENRLDETLTEEQKNLISEQVALNDNARKVDLYYADRVENQEIDIAMPLQYAALNGHVQATRTLLDGGSDPFYQTQQGIKSSAMALAANSGADGVCAEIVDYVIVKQTPEAAVDLMRLRLQIEAGGSGSKNSDNNHDFYDHYSEPQSEGTSKTGDQHSFPVSYNPTLSHNPTSRYWQNNTIEPDFYLKDSIKYLDKAFDKALRNASNQDRWGKAADNRVRALEIENGGYKEELFKACLASDIKKVKRLINDKEKELKDPDNFEYRNFRRELGQVARIAAAKGDQNIIAFLEEDPLLFSKLIVAEGESNDTPFSLALYNGQKDILNVMMDHLEKVDEASLLKIQSDLHHIGKVRDVDLERIQEEIDKRMLKIGIQRFENKVASENIKRSDTDIVEDMSDFSLLEMRREFENSTVVNQDDFEIIENEIVRRATPYGGINHLNEQALAQKLIDAAANSDYRNIKKYIRAGAENNTNANLRTDLSQAMSKAFEISFKKGDQKATTMMIDEIYKRSEGKKTYKMRTRDLIEISKILDKKIELYYAVTLDEKIKEAFGKGDDKKVKNYINLEKMKFYGDVGEVDQYKNFVRESRISDKVAKGLNKEDATIMVEEELKQRLSKVSEEGVDEYYKNQALRYIKSEQRLLLKGVSAANKKTIFEAGDEYGRITQSKIEIVKKLNIIMSGARPVSINKDVSRYRNSCPKSFNDHKIPEEIAEETIEEWAERVHASVIYEDRAKKLAASKLDKVEDCYELLEKIQKISALDDMTNKGFEEKGNSWKHQTGLGRTEQRTIGYKHVTGEKPEEDYYLMRVLIDDYGSAQYQQDIAKVYRNGEVISLINEKGDHGYSRIMMSANQDGFSTRDKENKLERDKPLCQGDKKILFSSLDDYLDEAELTSKRGLRIYNKLRENNKDKAINQKDKRYEVAIETDPNDPSKKLRYSIGSDGVIHTDIRGQGYIRNKLIGDNKASLAKIYRVEDDRLNSDDQRSQWGVITENNNDVLKLNFGKKATDGTNKELQVIMFTPSRNNQVTDEGEAFMVDASKHNVADHEVGKHGLKGAELRQRNIKQLICDIVVEAARSARMTKDQVDLCLALAEDGIDVGSYSDADFRLFIQSQQENMSSPESRKYASKSLESETVQAVKFFKEFKNLTLQYGIFTHKPKVKEDAPLLNEWFDGKLLPESIQGLGFDELFTEITKEIADIDKDLYLAKSKDNPECKAYERRLAENQKKSIKLDENSEVKPQEKEKTPKIVPRTGTFQERERKSRVRDYSTGSTRF